MRHQNSVFHASSEACAVGCVRAAWWSSTARTARVRRLTTKSQFVALLYGQLAGAASLREIAAGWRATQRRLYHLGAHAPRALDAGRRQRAAPVRGVRRSVGGDDGAAPIAACAASSAETTYLIDSTGLGSIGAAPIGRASRPRCAAPSCTSSTTPMPTGRSMPRSPRHGSTTSPPPRRCRSSPAPPTSSTSAITTTLGGRSSTSAGCRIVTRFKRNTPLAVIEELPVAAGTAPSCPTASASCRTARRNGRRNPLRRRGARGARHDRDRQGAAHPVQRSRRPGRRRSPISISAAGPSSCSSAGSSRP